MRIIKKYNPNETGQILNGFISRYVNQDKLRKNILLWNSLKDEIDRKCISFSQISGFDFFKERPVLLYDEREKALYQVEWSEVVDFITRLEPQGENIDFMIFDKTLDWFCAITHEDLKTICAGSELPAF